MAAEDLRDDERKAAIVRAISEARKREREYCARIADSFAADYGAEIGHMAKRIAEVIRRQS